MLIHIIHTVPGHGFMYSMSATDGVDDTLFKIGRIPSDGDELCHFNLPSGL